jgi:hypothetical protein
MGEGRAAGRRHDAPHASDEAAHPGGEGPAAQQHSIRARCAGAGAASEGEAGGEANPSPPAPRARGETGRGGRNRNGILPWTGCQAGIGGGG